jgi:hypothetical protein
MAIHNFRTVEETEYLLLVMDEKGGYGLTKIDLAVRVVTNPEFNAGLVPLRDKYCHKTESESK